MTDPPNIPELMQDATVAAEKMTEDLGSDVPSIGLPVKTDDELRCYFVINTDLAMSLGKTAIQVAHATQYLLDKRDELLAKCDLFFICSEEQKDILDQAFLFNRWKNSPAHCKIAKAANTNEFNAIKAEYAGRCVVVRDAGRTEIAPGSETVVALYPMKKSEQSKLLKRLRLL